MSCSGRLTRPLRGERVWGAKGKSREEQTGASRAHRLSPCAPGPRPLLGQWRLVTNPAPPGAGGPSPGPSGGAQATQSAAWARAGHRGGGSPAPVGQRVQELCREVPAVQVGAGQTPGEGPATVSRACLTRFSASGSAQGSPPVTAPSKAPGAASHPPPCPDPREQPLRVLQ